jgi:hypothetical protein
MLYSRCIIAGLDDLGTELLVVGDVQFPFIIQESIEFFPLKKIVDRSARAFFAEYFKSLSDFDFAIGAILNLLFKCRGFGEGSGSEHDKSFGIEDQLIPIVFSVCDLEAQGMEERVGNTVFLARLVD